MGTKNLNENDPNPFFGGGTKNMVRVNLIATILFWHGFDKSKLVYAREIQNEIVEWKCPPICIFQNKSVRYA